MQRVDSDWFGVARKRHSSLTVAFTHITKANTSPPHAWPLHHYLAARLSNIANTRNTHLVPPTNLWPHSQLSSTMPSRSRTAKMPLFDEFDQIIKNAVEKAKAKIKSSRLLAAQEAAHTPNLFGSSTYQPSYVLQSSSMQSRNRSRSMSARSPLYLRSRGHPNSSAPNHVRCTSPRTHWRLRSAMMHSRWTTTA